MGERHEAALGKEKRLESVARPVARIDEKVQSETKDNSEGSKTKKAVKPALGNEKLKKKLTEDEAMQQEDEVKEGIDWSDEEGGGDAKGGDDDEEEDNDGSSSGSGDDNDDDESSSGSDGEDSSDESD
mmetsp:Transcript_1910/g.3371  ORF Transcript_1910/g.3371 Transcript_1910/m.3371 type:complete len:128 (-) Transcript_1910:453-836(-)